LEQQAIQAAFQEPFYSAYKCEIEMHTTKAIEDMVHTVKTIEKIGIV